MVDTQRLTINGTTHNVTGDLERPLLSVLRDELDLTGTKYGCGEAQCGACVVLVDGVRAPSCITPVRDVVGKPITTIEGLNADGKLHPVQEAFLETEAFQCGYCTPGMIMGTVSLLNINPHPTDAEIITALDKHLCRCGSYRRILKAIHLAAQKMSQAAAVTEQSQ
jgi:aerobic-type carbon monoxide dehydrogenase small subunit (CoxS/CutS family)